jgi:hypothetical protein
VSSVGEGKEGIEVIEVIQVQLVPQVLRVLVGIPVRQGIQALLVRREEMDPLGFVEQPAILETLEQLESQVQLDQVSLDRLARRGQQD